MPGAKKKKTFTISAPLQNGQREIRAGEFVAYGDVSPDGETYNMAHAPTKKDLDTISAVMDFMTPAQIRAAIERDAK